MSAKPRLRGRRSRLIRINFTQSPQSLNPILRPPGPDPSQRSVYPVPRKSFQERNTDMTAETNDGPNNQRSSKPGRENSALNFLPLGLTGDPRHPKFRSAPARRHRALCRARSRLLRRPLRRLLPRRCGRIHSRRPSSRSGLAHLSTQRNRIRICIRRHRTPTPLAPSPRLPASLFRPSRSPPSKTIATRTRNATAARQPRQPGLRLDGLDRQRSGPHALALRRDRERGP